MCLACWSSKKSVAGHTISDERSAVSSGVTNTSSTPTQESSKSMPELPVIEEDEEKKVFCLQKMALVYFEVTRIIVFFSLIFI